MIVAVFELKMVLQDWMHGGCDGDDDVNLNLNNKITFFFEKILKFLD